MLGALVQATPYSKVEKKVVELPGGRQARPSPDVLNIGGSDILDNNQVQPLTSILIQGEFCNDILHHIHLNGVICFAFLHIITGA